MEPAPRGGGMILQRPNNYGIMCVVIRNLGSLTKIMRLVALDCAAFLAADIAGSALKHERTQGGFGS